MSAQEELAPLSDHRDPGTAAAAWSASIDALPDGAAVGPHDHVLVLIAHATDETLGCGALLADAARAGAQITVVVASDGPASHPDPSAHHAESASRIRRARTVSAVRLLAPTARLVLLDRPDGRLDRDHDDLHRATAPLAPDATVVVTTWREDGHPDHAACGRVAARLCAETGARLLEFPMWGWKWGVPGRSGPLHGFGWVRRVASPMALSTRAAALAEYCSKTTALSSASATGPVLDGAFLQHFTRPVEVYRAEAQSDLPARYFERLYAADDDPWRVAELFYEKRKRALMLACLPRPSFAHAFEPGCGTGLLTEALAARCDHLQAMDASATAAAYARTRLAGRSNVDVSVGVVPADWPDDRFDLVVLSELGYYLADVEALADRARAALTDDGVLVGCHWRHPAPGYPSTAERVHEALGRHLVRVAGHVEADFLLDVWSVDGRSVAERDGIVEAAVEAAFEPAAGSSR